jgi:hypothetical protein
MSKSISGTEIKKLWKSQGIIVPRTSAEYDVLCIIVLTIQIALKELIKLAFRDKYISFHSIEIV